MLLRKPAPDSRSRIVPPLYAPCGIAVLLAAQALTGCTPKTDVSLTADVPAQYAHVFVTFQQVWFNTDPNAGPDESGWQKFTLVSPDTVDLFSAAEGTLTQLTTGLKVSAGTYNQLRL